MNDEERGRRRRKKIVQPVLNASRVSYFYLLCYFIFDAHPDIKYDWSITTNAAMLQKLPITCYALFCSIVTYYATFRTSVCSCFFGSFVDYHDYVRVYIHHLLISYS